MRKRVEHFPNWCNFLFEIAYVLPFPALVIYDIVVLWWGTGFLGMLGGFIGGFVVSGMIFLPFGGIYYAAVAFIHTLVHELAFRSHSKKKSGIPILISFVCSSFLALNSVFAIQYLEEERGGVCFIMIPIGFLLIRTFLARRVFTSSPEKTKEKE